MIRILNGLLVSLLLSSCCNKTVTITNLNNSDNNTYYAFGGGNLSTDTLLYKSANFSFIDIKGIESYTFSDRHPTFGCNYSQLDVLKGQLLQDTLYMLFVSEDSITKYGFDKVLSDWNFNARYKLSANDIDNLNYQIPYPPTPEMDLMNIVLR